MSLYIPFFLMTRTTQLGTLIHDISYFWRLSFDGIDGNILKRKNCIRIRKLTKYHLSKRQIYKVEIFRIFIHFIYIVKQVGKQIILFITL